MDVKYRLAAIVSADVVGYSRLMSEDEDATVRTLRATCVPLYVSPEVE